MPFENPTGLSNFLEVLAILLIPAAQVFMFGKMVGARRQGWVLFAAMFAMFAIGVAIALPAEQHGSAVLRNSGVNITQGNGQSGGNMSDKEIRFGIANSALWTVPTTDASNGSVNSGHDAYTPAGGAVLLVNIFVGEVIFGGVGSGLYGMFFYVVIAVFVAGLMIGRTPEYLGKKIEAREIKYAAIGALFVPTMVLIMTGVSVVTKLGLASIFNPGAHGFTEALYAYTSQSNNNGSAFAGYGATNFSAEFGTVALYLGRWVPLIAALALAGSLARQEDGARLRRDVPHRRPDLRRPARGRDRAHRRADDLPRPDARPDRGRTVPLMRAFVSSVIAVVVLTAFFGLAYPAVMTGFAAVAFPDKAGGSLIEQNGTVVGSSLAAQEFTATKYFHERPSATVARLQRRRHHLRQPRPDEPDARHERRTTAAAGDPRARGAVQPRPDRP